MRSVWNQSKDIERVPARETFRGSLFGPTVDNLDTVRNVDSEYRLPPRSFAQFAHTNV
jgi:hypothetical protein